MKTKTINLYEFDELPEDVKAKVIENERHINTDYDWHELTIEEWENKLEEMGFDDPTISFSGFYSQGDGASFVCKHVDVEKFITSQKVRGKFKAILKAIKKEDAEVNISLYRIDHHYSHEYTISAESETIHNHDDDDAAKYIRLETEEGELRKLVLETARNLSRKVYRELETKYNYLTEDAQIIETIKANEYTFTINGKMENS